MARVYFVSNLRGNAFSFSTLFMTLAVGFLYTSFIMLEHFSSLPSLLSILSQKEAGFCHVFFCITERTM